MINISHILLVEDNPDDQFFFRTYAGKSGLNGVRIDCVELLQQAIVAAGEQPFDLVFFDLGLPDGNGMPALSEFKKAHPELPVVVLTGLEDLGVARDAMKSGAVDYVPKSELSPAVIERTVRYVSDKIRAEQELKAIERRNRAILNALPDIMFIVDEQGVYLECLMDDNSVLMKPWKEIVGCSKYDILPEPIADRHLMLISELLQGGEPSASEDHLEINGESCWFDTRFIMMSDNRILQISKDITESKKAALERQEREHRISMISENINEMVYQVSLLDGEVVVDYVSPKIVDILGFTQEDYASKSKDFISALREEDLDEARAFNREVWAATEPRTYTHTYQFHHKIRKEWIWVEESIVPYFDTDGKVIGRFGTVRDITVRRESELKQEVLYNISRAASRRIINLEILSKTIHTEIGKIIDATNMYIAIHDQKTDMISFPYVVDESQNSEAFNPRPLGEGITERVLNKKKPLWIGPKGSGAPYTKEDMVTQFGVVPSNWLGVPLKGDGRTIGVLSIASYKEESVFSEGDAEFLQFVSIQIAAILEKQLIQEDLIRSEEYFRALTENATDLTLVVNEEHKIVYISQSISRLLGISPVELIGRSLFMLIPKTERVEVLSYIEEWKEREDPLMKELQVELGGSTVWLEIWGNNMLHDPSIRGIIINARDVTARKQAEAVLLRTRNKLALLHKIDTAILRADSSQEIAKVVIQLIEEHLVPADRLSIALFNLEKEEIFFLSVQSDESSAIKAGEVLPLSSFRNVDLLQKGEYYIVEDIEAKGVISDSDKALLNEGIRSYLIYPLLYRGELIGSLNLGSKDTDFFTETHIEVLSEAADQMALAIFDSRLNIEIKEQEEKFRGIFESISDLFYQTTMDGEILLVSPSCEQVTGYTVEEMEGKNVNEFLVDTEVRNKYINDVIGEGMAANFEFAIRHKSGKIVYLLDNSRLILDDNGEPIGTQGTLTDITELKDAQDQFIEEHQHALQYQSMLLSSQLNPHFIFNSLNSIQYYILDQSVEPALNYLADFSKLMRSVLQNSLRPHITLEEEIQFLTLYMDLERMRFANKFDYEFLVDDEIEEDLTMIPPMLLQPYLENTVVHGLAPKESDGHVLVEFKRDDKQVICSIKDNGIGRKKAEELKKLRTGGKSHRSVSMGINQTRLDLLNAVEDDAYTVQVTDLINVSGEPSGTEIMITFPIIVE